MSKTKARLDITVSNPILVDANLCDLCGACVSVCPPDVIEMDEHTLNIVEGCIKCGLCLPVCPLKALGWNENGVGSNRDNGGNGNGR